MVKKVLILLVSGILSLCAGILLMYLAYLVPVSRIAESAKKDRELFDIEGDYPCIISGYEFTRLDNFTDSQILDEAVYDEKKGALYGALLVPSAVYSDAGSMHEQVYRYIDGDKGYEQYDRGRYWHGYHVVLKPLLAFLPYRDIRLLNLIIQLAIAVLLTAALSKKTGTGASCAFIVTYIFLFPPAIALCMEFSLMYYVSTISAFILLKGCFERGNIFMLFLFTGIAAAFFDYLTYPLLTLSMPLAIWLLTYDKPDADMLKNELYYSVCWLFGYVFMWGGKWVIATAVTGEDVIKEGWDNVIFRASGRLKGEEESLGYLNVITRQFKVAGCVPFILVLIIIIFSFLFLSVIKKEKWDLIRSAGLILICIFPFLWYFVLRNHSVVHDWFTYRTFSVLIFAACCLFLCPESSLKRV